jgi:hypothetical protein
VVNPEPLKEGTMAHKFSLAAIETAKQNLDAMPAAARETREVNLKEAIKTLSPTIRKLLRRGHSRAKVVELLREQGVPVSLSTLKQYFREKAPASDDAESQTESLERVTNGSRAEADSGLTLVRPSVASSSGSRRADGDGNRAADSGDKGATSAPRSAPASTRGPARS